jgi:hypothetical protein
VIQHLAWLGIDVTTRRTTFEPKGEPILGAVTLRRYVSVAVVALVLALAVTAESADARTIRVKWTDTQSRADGRIVYRTTKIWLRGDRFSVDVAVTNRTKHDLMFFPATGPDDPTYIPRPGFGLAWREPPSPNIQTRRLRTVISRSISRDLPFRLRVGKTVHLTFGGRSPLLRTHRTWWVTFGRSISWTRGKRPLAMQSGDHWYSAKTFDT